jgi:hypothetical protein
LEKTTRRYVTLAVLRYAERPLTPEEILDRVQALLASIASAPATSRPVAGDILGVRILDHVIVGDGRYHSMCDAGQL